MKKIIPILATLAFLSSGSAQGAFVSPTREQLKDAAGTPRLVVPLVVDANPEQAAMVGKDVIIHIVQLGLKPEDRDERIRAVIGYLFQAIESDQHALLAVALGKAIAASPAASMSPAAISVVQQAIIAFANMELGSAFGNAYMLAMQSVAGAPGGGKTVPPQPPPPPVALPYEGQRLR